MSSTDDSTPPETLTQVEFEKLTRDLMAEHLDDSWTFAWNDAINRLGFCSHEKHLLSFSRHAFADGVSYVAAHNTITHELAHAMLPETEHHGAAWKAQHIALGGDANMYVGGRGGTFSPVLAEANKAQRKFLGRCPGCQREIRRVRRSYISCGRCSGGKGFTEKFRFVWFRIEEDESLTPFPMRRRK
jgi:SprT protein